MLSNALSLLPFQFQNKENWVKYLTSIISPLDQINSTYQDNPLFDIDNSTGEQLDMCGNIIGISRNSLSDNEYRIILKQQVILNNTNGTAENFIRSINILLNPKQFYYFNDYGHIVCYLNLELEISSEIYAQIVRIAPVGFGINIYFTINGEIVLNNNFIQILVTFSEINNSKKSFLVENNNPLMLTNSSEINDISKANFTQPLGIFSDKTPIKFANGFYFLVGYFRSI